MSESDYTKNQLDTTTCYKIIIVLLLAFCVIACLPDNYNFTYPENKTSTEMDFSKFEISSRQK